jgi:nitroreductase
VDYENLLNVIKQRRTIRRYKEGEVPIEDVMKVLDAARWAASGNNTQPWEFVLVRDQQKLHEVTEILLEQNEVLVKYVPQFSWANKDYLRKVSTLIFVCGDPRFKAAYPQSDASEQLAAMYRENSERIYIQSIAAAVCNILLAATSLGLGTTWITGTAETVVEQKLKDALKIPQVLDIICCIPLGYLPSELPSPRVPRPLGNVVHLDVFDASMWRTDEFVEQFVNDKHVRAKYFKTGDRINSLNATTD